MTLRLDDILSDFHGSAVSGGATSVGAEIPVARVRRVEPKSTDGNKVARASALGVSSPAAIFPFIIGALLALLALSVCAAEFYGTVEVVCGKTNVVWRNVPAHVFVQGTIDTTNWFDLTEHRTIDGSPLGSFSFRIPTRDANALYRLRTP